MAEATYHIVENVWHRISSDLKREIVRFWMERNALTIREEAVERAEEVVFVVRSLGRKIVGICTAKEIFSERLNNFVYFYRTMIAPEHRRSGLAVDLLIKTRDFLEARFVEGIEEKAIGILLTMENEEMNATFRQALCPKTGFVFMGFNRNRHQVRVYYFKGVKF